MAKEKVFTAVAIGLGVLVLLAVLLNSAGQPDDNAKTAPVEPAVQGQAFNTGNPQNDKLLALSPDAQAEILGQLVADGCVGSRAFYRGMLKRTEHETKQEERLANALSDQMGAAFWSVACTNGSSYEVEIPADQDAHSRTLSCATVSALGDDCFSPFTK